MGTWGALCVLVGFSLGISQRRGLIPLYNRSTWIYNGVIESRALLFSSGSLMVVYIGYDRVSCVCCEVKVVNSPCIIPTHPVCCVVLLVAMFLFCYYVFVPEQRSY